jgi:hypothetical protein
MNYVILAPGIVEFKNIIQSPDLLIKDIENLDIKISNNLGQTLLDQWKPWIYGYENKDKPTLCMYKNIPMENEINKKDLFYNDQIQITKILNDSIELAKNEYCKIYTNLKKNLNNKERFSKLLKYLPENMMPEHSDEGNTSRTLSMVAYLNEDYVGGEIIFRNFNISIKPSAGSIICFPSNFVYLHEVSKIISGVRYSYPVWYHNKSKQDLPINEKLVKDALL